jgi:hypothetical protein
LSEPLFWLPLICIALGFVLALVNLAALGQLKNDLDAHLDSECDEYDDTAIFKAVGNLDAELNDLKKKHDILSARVYESLKPAKKLKTPARARRA